MQLLISIIVVALIAAAFAWLATRAWKADRAIIKWPGVLLAGLLTVVFALVAVVGLIGFIRLTMPASNPVPNVQVTASAEQRARGERLANICASCHSSTGGLPLDGGMENFAAISGGPTLGVVYAPNLTPGGTLRDWSDGEIVRAIREGVEKGGRPLIVMPSETYHDLSDADTQAIVAYLRSQPAVDRTTPRTEVNLLGALLIGAGQFATSVQAPITQAVVAPPIGPTADYGRYVASISDCAGCHGTGYTGGDPGGFAPAGPNIVAAAQRWSDADFVRTIRTGVDAEGRSLDPERMPWKSFSAAYTDDELRALHAYLRTLPAS